MIHDKQLPLISEFLGVLEAPRLNFRFIGIGLDLRTGVLLEPGVILIPGVLLADVEPLKAGVTFKPFVAGVLLENGVPFKTLEAGVLVGIGLPFTPLEAEVLLGIGIPMPLEVWLPLKTGELGSIFNIGVLLATGVFLGAKVSLPAGVLWGAGAGVGVLLLLEVDFFAADPLLDLDVTTVGEDIVEFKDELLLEPFGVILKPKIITIFYPIIIHFPT